MTKSLFTCLSFLFPFFASAQVVDTAAVRGEVDSLVGVCRDLTGKKQFEEALQVIEAATKKAESAFGKESPMSAKCIFNHGRVFYQNRQYEEGEKLYLKSISIVKNLPDCCHTEQIIYLNGLTVLYYFQAEYIKAEKILLEVIEMQREILGNKHPDYLDNLNNLAFIYKTMGEYEKSKFWSRQVQTICIENSDKENPVYASSLNGLGVVYEELGEYKQAETLYLESKAIYEKILGKENTKYADVLNKYNVLIS